MASEKILIVEDERIIALRLEQTLTTMGYAVVGIAARGEEALRLAGTLQPDLILMDIVIQGEMDGIEVARQIQTTSKVPVIFVTAYGDEETLTRVKGIEPFGYILKPFRTRELQMAIEIAIFRHRQEGQQAKLIAQLQEALGQIKQLRGLLPICANCKKIRDDQGYWTHVEAYIEKHSDAQFSHGICPGCVKKLYPELY